MLVLNREKTLTRPVVPLPAADDLLRRLLQRLQAASALVLDHHLEAAGIADATDGRRRDRDDEGVLDAAQPADQLALETVGGQAVLQPFLERRHGGEDGPGIGRVGEGGAVEARERDGVVDALGFQDDLGRFAHHGVGAGQG